MLFYCRTIFPTYCVASISTFILRFFPSLFSNSETIVDFIRDESYRARMYQVLLSLTANVIQDDS
ncbi:uncharacterized protein PHALS_15293 [Plasmopara halstedii]|uniref:Uncharacterized protein n=1 Tax=Plasmopara halstedii TaxID=4781 RepID=A0A0P1ACB5_PLAHL|nr:uncharacterized protein PHALS_15293 [Plasmopara halstedii]CEG38146.1 hypothetical protein PHALS_15293 [Plasmopara halstedii]|eukprot:XP_024574515.1 hypothetical protein PHALS_15293 [Plasmopara halstedii]